MEPEVSVNNNEELPPYSDNEKHLLLSDNEKCDLEEVPTSYRVTRHSNKFKRFCQILSLFGVLYLVNFLYINRDDFARGMSTHFRFNCGSLVSQQPLQETKLDHHPIFRNLIDVVDTTYSDQQEGNNTAKEIISVTNPYTPNPRYGESLYTTTLIKNHKFGNSWNQPAVVNFTAPSIFLLMLWF